MESFDDLEAAAVGKSFQLGFRKMVDIAQALSTTAPIQ
jgi:hypothetical protein